MRFQRDFLRKSSGASPASDTDFIPIFEVFSLNLLVLVNTNCVLLVDGLESLNFVCRCCFAFDVLKWLKSAHLIQFDTNMISFKSQMSFMYFLNLKLKIIVDFELKYMIV